MEFLFLSAYFLSFPQYTVLLGAARIQQTLRAYFLIFWSVLVLRLFAPILSGTTSYLLKYRLVQLVQKWGLQCEPEYLSQHFNGYSRVVNFIPISPHTFFN